MRPGATTLSAAVARTAGHGTTSIDKEPAIHAALAEAEDRCAGPRASAAPGSRSRRATARWGHPGPVARSSLATDTRPGTLAHPSPHQGTGSSPDHPSGKPKTSDPSLMLPRSRRRAGLPVAKIECGASAAEPIFASRQGPLMEFDHVLTTTPSIRRKLDLRRPVGNEGARRVPRGGAARAHARQPAVVAPARRARPGREEPAGRAVPPRRPGIPGAVRGHRCGRPGRGPLGGLRPAPKGARTARTWPTRCSTAASSPRCGASSRPCAHAAWARRSRRSI